MQPHDVGRGRDPYDRRDPHAVPPASRRTEILASGALNVLLGGWLAASPFVLGYGETRRSSGRFVAALACIAASATEQAQRAARR